MFLFREVTIIGVSLSEPHISELLTVCLVGPWTVHLRHVCLLNIEDNAIFKTFHNLVNMQVT